MRAIGICLAACANECTAIGAGLIVPGRSFIVKGRVVACEDLIVFLFLATARPSRDFFEDFVRNPVFMVEVKIEAFVHHRHS